MRIENVILSYAHVMEPQVISKDNPQPNELVQYEYSTKILIPKDSPQIQAIKAEINQAAQRKDKKTGQFVLPSGKLNAEAGHNIPLKDGQYSKDTFDHDYYTINARLKPRKGQQMPPKLPVVDKAMAPITDPDQVYSGCVANVFVEFFSYDFMKGGVSAKLLGVQKVADGERLDGGGTPAVNSMFEASEGAFAEDPYAGTDTTDEPGW